MADLKITQLTATTTPADADLLETVTDVATTPVNKKITWTSIKAFLKTYFDGIYQPLATVLTNTTASFTSALESKLNGIEAGADVTDEANVVSALDGATLPTATVAGTDKVLIQDTDDNDELKTVTAQSIADLGGGSGAMSLLISASGSSTTEGAENVSTVAISGLTAKDRLVIFYNLTAEVNSVGATKIYNVTDSLNITETNEGNSYSAGDKVVGRAELSQAQSSDKSWFGVSSDMQQDAVNVPHGNFLNNTMTQAWTGSWTLGLRKSSLTAGATFRWSWSVYKVAGQ